ncbi:hypothetical protein MYX04_14000, partial [Nitrospiraceae bacterium AH_259_D15_M11_P09]|nr:hypothetical protein [Nitrospiraceae bacterium AH_259_D15_M11_P09]
SLLIFLPTDRLCLLRRAAPMTTGLVRADVAISEHGVEAVDVRVPRGHRADAFVWLARALPALRELDRSLKAPNPAEPDR